MGNREEEILFEVILREKCCMIKKKSLLNYCGLLGVVAFLSYTVTVIYYMHLRQNENIRRRYGIKYN